MCGIAGIVQSNNSNMEKSYESISKMLFTLNRRGPDHSGIVSRDNAVFGHTRLSIIDLTEYGQQPMELENLMITFNGEIYNYKELKNRIQTEFPEFRFRGNSDTEVLLATIKFKGLEYTLKEAEGMFALALFDENTQKLYLTRDRAGEKPLSYCIRGESVIFASTLDALLDSQQVDAEICPESLGEYLNYNFICAPKTIYKGVYKVKPGTILEIFTADTGIEVTETDYFKIESATTLDNCLVQVDKVEQLLNDSVESVLQSDVPLGTFLSGGIDSSLVTAIAVKHFDQRLKTFCIGFDDKNLNEAHYAANIADKLNTEHYEFIMSRRDVLDNVQNISKAYDEPFSDFSQLPTLFLTEMAQNQITVALTGDGADELFNGYRRYDKATKFNNLFFDKRYRYFFSSIHHVFNHSGKIINRLRIPIQGSDRLIKLNRLAQSNDIYEALMLNNLGQLNIGYSFDRHIRKGYPNEIEDLSRGYALRDFYTYLPDDIFVKVDRASMYNSLETRTPFLNSQLIQYAYSIPSRDKKNGGLSKYHLKSILGKYLESSLFERPKQGFSIPLEEWLRTILFDWANELISSNSFKGLIDEKLHKMIKEEWVGFIQESMIPAAVIWNRLMLLDWLLARKNKIKGCEFQ